MTTLINFFSTPPGFISLLVGMIFLFVMGIILFCFVLGCLQRAHAVKMATLGYEQVTETVSEDNGEGGESWKQITSWKKVRKDESIISDQIEEAVRTMERTVAVIDEGCDGMPDQGYWKLLGARSTELKKSIGQLKA